MNKIVLKIHEYLEQAAEGKIKVDPELLEEFGKRVQAKLKNKLEEQKEFRLRMSNIGRPLRQLMLEQKYGKGKPDPEFMLKMLFGDLYESLVLYLLKASGVEVTEQDTEVSIPVQTKKGTVNIGGTLDVGIKIKDEDGIYDIKSASPYSFDNKFEPASILTGDDSFGYVDQLFGYAKARKKKAKGWIVINKSNGQIKVCDVPPELHDSLMEKSQQIIQTKVSHIVEGKPIPECSGVVPEKFFGKPTGNTILGPSCKFCSCKKRCHPNIQYRPSLVSKAKEPKWEHYITIKETANVK